MLMLKIFNDQNLKKEINRLGRIENLWKYTECYTLFISKQRLVCTPTFSDRLSAVLHSA